MPNANELSPGDILALRKKYCVPDWRRPREYDYADPKAPFPLTDDRLRWEFLRRDPAYRAAVEDESSDLRLSDFGLYEWISPEVRGDELGYRHILFTDSVHRGGQLWAAAEVSKDLDDIDPDKRDKMFALRFGQYVLNLEESGYVVVVFDPRRPPEPQIARAQEVLKHHRKEAFDNEFAEPHSLTKKEKGETSKIIRHKNKPEDPCVLLRVLDAINEGVEPLEIGQKIYGVDSSGKEAKLIAKERIAKAKSCWRRM